MTNKKYELTDESMKLPCGVTVYRIRALRDFDFIEQGDLGGFVQSEYNLSHAGNAWVFDDAKVFDKARVIENAKVMKDATVFDAAIIGKRAIVSGSANVYKNAIVCDHALVKDYASVCGRAVIKDEAIVSDRASVEGKAIIGMHSRVGGDTVVGDEAEILTKSTVKFLYIDAYIRGKARILSKKDVITIGPIGSRASTLTAYRSLRAYNGGNIEVCTGCFHGSLGAFEFQVFERHRDNYVNLEQYRAVIAFIKKFFEISTGLKQS